MSKFIILIDEQRRTTAIEFIKNISLLKVMSIEIKEYKKSRSNAQNRTYWGWLNVIASETGYDKDELHETLKIRLIGTEEKLIFGQRVTLAKSTAKLGTKEFAEYMGKVEILAASMDIRLPIPDDYRYALMLDAA